MNYERPNTNMAPDILFETLAALNEKESGNVKHIGLTSDFSTVELSDGRELMYDRGPSKLMTADEWYKGAPNFRRMRTEHRAQALKRQKIDEVYNAFEKWLSIHDSIRQTQTDADIKGPDCSHFIVKRSLKYGYSLSGIWFQGDDIIFEIQVFDRVIKTDDQLKGIDHVYLMYRNNVIMEADLDYRQSSNGSKETSETDFEVEFVPIKTHRHKKKAEQYEC